jgi:hypothetical protein
MGTGSTSIATLPRHRPASGPNPSFSAKPVVASPAKAGDTMQLKHANKLRATSGHSFFAAELIVAAENLIVASSLRTTSPDGYLRDISSCQFWHDVNQSSLIRVEDIGNC